MVLKGLFSILILTKQKGFQTICVGNSGENQNTEYNKSNSVRNEVRYYVNIVVNSERSHLFTLNIR